MIIFLALLLSILTTVTMSTKSAIIKKLRSRVVKVESIFQKVIESQAKVVMIGESSHGTADFYRTRCDLTKALIESGRCNGVLIEGDLPDTAELHRFVTGQSTKTLDETFVGFERFPSWMWANTNMKSFVDWLSRFNAEGRGQTKSVGIFGLDLYSLHLSMEKVIEYLEIDKEMQAMVKRSYACFGAFDPQTYGMLVERGLIKGCRKVAVDALKKISAKTAIYAKTDPRDETTSADEAFINEMNARVVVGAEKYYRTVSTYL